MGGWVDLLFVFNACSTQRIQDKIHRIEPVVASERALIS